MPPTKPTPASRPTRSDELVRVAQEYADLFNANPLEDIDRLIADACVDPFWDDRTNLLSLLADDPDELGLVLATNAEDYVVVRHVGRWVVDFSPVDWEALEDRAFDPDPDDGDYERSSD
jgi:hypothetical protein